MMLAAWRKVGFAGGRIDPALIDRSHFIDRIPVGSPSSGTRAVTKSIEEVVRTPPGARRGSLFAAQAKLDAAVALVVVQQAEIDALRSAPFDPETVPFLMKPKEHEAKKKRDRSQADMSMYEGGSASLRNVRRTCEAKRAVVQQKADAVEGRKEERAGKKVAAEEESAQLVAAYELCSVACACGQSPCPMQAMKPCATCRAAGRLWIKPRMCVVRDCVAARKEPALLALTFVDEAPTPGMPTPLARLDYTGALSEEEDCTADEVMPAAKAKASIEIRCDWACAHPVLTAEEVEVGYCSGRRCKAKMHPECFLYHTGEAGKALGDLVCFCQACWAKQ